MLDLAERGEDLAGRADAEGHLAADDGDDGNVVVDLDAVRRISLRSSSSRLYWFGVSASVGMASEMQSMPLGGVRHGNAVVLKDLQNGAQRAHGAGKALFRHGDDGKIALARNAGHKALQVLGPRQSSSVMSVPDGPARSYCGC